QTMNFGEFAQAARVQAASLRAAGLKTGDTIVLVMPQGIPLLVAFAGAMRLGAAPAILAYPNFKTGPAKYSSGLSGVLANLKAPMVVAQDDLTEALLMEHLLRTDGSKTKIVRSASISDDNRSWLSDDDSSLPALPSDPDCVAFIQHSAGTTG